MEKLVSELRRIIPFQDTTDIGDIVLIVSKEPQMLVYALVTDISRDTSRKAEWWNISLTFLTIPPQEITWTLRTEQMTGMEIFTMGGEERFVKAVNFSPTVITPVTDKRTKKKKDPIKNPFLKRVK